MSVKTADDLELRVGKGSREVLLFDKRVEVVRVDAWKVTGRSVKKLSFSHILNRARTTHQEREQDT